MTSSGRGFGKRVLQDGKGYEDPGRGRGRGRGRGYEGRKYLLL